MSENHNCKNKIHLTSQINSCLTDKDAVVDKQQSVKWICCFTLINSPSMKIHGIKMTSEGMTSSTKATVSYSGAIHGIKIPQG
jgi:hypothetical protein